MFVAFALAASEIWAVSAELPAAKYWELPMYLAYTRRSEKRKC
jgi:hypothetical protein